MGKGHAPLRGNHSFRRAELEARLTAAQGQTLGQVDRAGVFRRAAGKDKITGIAGAVIEQSVLGLPADQAQSPDLDVDGVPIELKTIGVRKKTEGRLTSYEAKEPATITAVSLDKIAGETFEDSSFWHKAKHILFVFYHYDAPGTVPAGDYARFRIVGHRFYQFSPSDEAILRRDWQLVHDFVSHIQASHPIQEAEQLYPLLSTHVNRETAYLDTAPKYPNPPRFRLRRRVVSAIVQEALGPNELTRLPGCYTGYPDLERRCGQLTAQFRGRTIRQILGETGGPVICGTVPKHLAERTVVRMFGGEAKRISQIGLFQKFGYIGKTVTLSDRGYHTEATKLFPADLEEIAEPIVWEEDGAQRIKDFQDSELYASLQDSRMLFAIFQEPPSGGSGRGRLEDSIFQGFKVLELSDLIPPARLAWEEARRTLLSGGLTTVPVLDRLGCQRYTPKTALPMEAPNLPKAAEHVLFFRGGGKTAADKVEVLGISMLRQYYWVHGKFLAGRLRELPFLDGTWAPGPYGGGGAAP